MTLNGSVKIICETFDGNTSLGTDECWAMLYVTNSEPTVSATVVDSNSTTTALTGDSNKLIKYFSTAKVDITATAKNSAIIASRKVVCGDKSGTSTTNQLTNIESNVFVVSATDSRGFSSSTSITKTMIDYIKLAFTDISLSRPNTTSNTVNVNLTGNYFNQSFGNSSNTLNLKFRYRVTDGSWSSYTNITPTKSGNTFSLNSNLGSTYSFNNEYEFEIVATDKLMTVTQNVIVPRGIPVIDIGKEDIDLNCDIKQRGILIIDSGSNSDGEYIKYSNGTMICTKQISITADITATWGNMYDTGNQDIDLGDYAEAFISVPRVSITMASANGCWVEGCSDRTSTSFGKIVLASATSKTATVNYDLIAIGRWK